jgi:hypothetical protein
VPPARSADLPFPLSPPYAPGAVRARASHAARRVDEVRLLCALLIAGLVLTACRDDHSDGGSAPGVGLARGDLRRDEFGHAAEHLPSYCHSQAPARLPAEV